MLSTIIILDNWGWLGLGLIIGFSILIGTGLGYVGAGWHDALNSDREER